MSERGLRHSRASGRRRIAVVAGTLALLAAPGGSAAVTPPAGLSLPEPVAAAAVAEPLPAAEVSASQVRRALTGLTGDRRLGRRVAVAVAGLDGRPVQAQGPAAVIPASTLKVVTALVALETLGPEHRFATTTVRAGRQLVLVGGGDPLLARRPAAGEYPERADLTTLARRTARALTGAGPARVRLRFDATLFTGPAVSPTWEDDYLPDDVVSRISSLWVDEGRESVDEADRSEDPAAAAAEFFARQLRGHGVRVKGVPVAMAAPDGAPEVASVESAELVEVVQHVLETSDNEASEVLARHVAIAEGRPGSFAALDDVVPAVLQRLGVPTKGIVVRDGSGLSRANRLPLRTLLRALAVAADAEHPQLAGVVAGLPVAGWSGSLAYRFTTDADAGLGAVRAKTGTLTGVHGLAGVVTTADGSVLLFAAIVDRVKEENTLFARDRLDQVAAALAGCSCAARTLGP
jgi:serine-type D-Ala-D-Ala carboxypeptidase/endopeptidase (penicillin-binding protein 4)